MTGPREDRVILTTVQEAGSWASPLGRQRHGDMVWVALGDADFLAAAEAGTEATLLYLAEDEYRHATRELCDEEVENVVFKRRLVWSPTVMENCQNWLHFRDLCRLRDVAEAHAGATTPGATSALAGLFEQLLVGAAERASPPPRPAPLAFALLAALMRDSTLLAELGDLESRAELAPSLLSVGQVRQHAVPVQRMLADLGKEVFLAGLPAAGARRAFCVEGASDGLITSFVQRQVSVLPVAGRYLVDWPIAAADELRAASTSVTQITLSPHDLHQMTEAQRERDLEQELARSGVDRHRELEDRLLLAWAVNAAERRALATLAATEQPTRVEELRSEIAKETTELRRALALRGQELGRELANNEDVLTGIDAQHRHASLFLRMAGRLRHEQYEKEFARSLERLAIERRLVVQARSS
ncbi:MAG: hypothetical protein JW751_30660 [Polyangiaceae bacterium]|nr:hypothetical protein [Polyangiaceae bacterium]